MGNSLTDLCCYVQCDGDLIEIKMWANDIDGIEHISVKDVRNWDTWDNIDTREDVLEQFGEEYYKTLDDFKQDNSKHFKDWFDKLDGAESIEEEYQPMSFTCKYGYGQPIWFIDKDGVLPGEISGVEIRFLVTAYQPTITYCIKYKNAKIGDGTLTWAYECHVFLTKKEADEMQEGMRPKEEK